MLYQTEQNLNYTDVKIPYVVDDENEVYKYKSHYIITDFSQQTTVQKIIDHWYVVIGIIIGMIIICIGVALLIKFDVFNKVRIYREEIDEIHSARSSRLRSSEAPELFRNEGMNNMEMKPLKSETKELK